jgi:hypothetical protein
MGLVTVAPRRSALADLPKAQARAEAGRLFGIRYVLTGRLKQADGLTLLLLLHEHGREIPIWSQDFTGATNGLIELEQQAIRAVAAVRNAPFPSATSQRVGEKLTNNLAAWRLVNKADRESDAMTREESPRIPTT